MISRISAFLLAYSALCASPAVAQSAPPSQDDIAALRAQIQAMQTQLDRLQADQAAAPPVAVPPKPAAPDWWDDTKISGKAFFNVSTIDQKSDGADSSANGTQAELKRFYLGVDHKFNDTFSANLTTDFRYGTNGTSKDVLVYVKKAYVQAKLSPAFFVRVGSADLPWVPFAEGLYGYRFVENELIDRTKFGTSADWGVHVGGSLANGLVSYAASAINGAGYKTLSRSSNTIDLEGRISVNPIKPITLGVGAYTGKLGKSADNLPDSATPHRATRFNAIAAYTDKRLRAGIEYFAAKNWNNVNTLASDKSNGWSAFASFAFTPKIAVFGRYDWVKPSRDLNPDLKDRYFNIGLNYKPIPPLDLALVYKRDRATDGFISTSNGTIGGLDRGTYDEIGLFGQIAF
ncbi:MAG TPA: porin [Sphingomicrobium sp.]|nr:porin [Sphingomicrobium sp.]